MLAQNSVLLLQKVLKEFGYLDGETDGVLGALTIRGVEKLKTSNDVGAISAFQDVLRDVGAWDHESTGYFLKLTQAAWQAVVDFAKWGDATCQESTSPAAGAKNAEQKPAILASNAPASVPPGGGGKPFADETPENLAAGVADIKATIKEGEK
jgi:lysozyme family protein